MFHQLKLVLRLSKLVFRLSKICIETFFLLQANNRDVCSCLLTPGLPPLNGSYKQCPFRSVRYVPLLRATTYFYAKILQFHTTTTFYTKRRNIVLFVIYSSFRIYLPII